MSKKTKSNTNKKTNNKTIMKIQIALGFFAIFAEIMNIHVYLSKLENK